MSRISFCVLLLTSLFALPGCGQRAPRLSVRSLDPFVDARGGRYHLPEADKCSAIVLLFVGYDCPISNGYTQEIVRLCEKYTPQKVAFCVVYADADITYESAHKHATEFELPCPAILDPEMVLALKYGATIKPEAVVLAPNHALLYRGRIDDRYLDFGKRRENLTSHELIDALDAVLSGRTITIPRTQAVGCDIDLPPQEQ